MSSRPPASPRSTAGCDVVGPNVLTLREYEQATIGESWIVARKEITPRDAVALEMVQASMAGDVVSVGRRAVKAQNFVGTISLGRRTIEVLPKIDRDTSSTRQRLVEMLAVARTLPFRESAVSAQSSKVVSVLDAFMRVYLDHLTVEWRRGRIANYRKTDRNRTCLKGKLLFADQIRRNLLHPERFYTRCDEFIHDVPPCQLLKAGLQVCRRFAAMHAIRRDAMSLLMEFDGVSDVSFQRSQLSAIQTDRRSERFSPLISLAKRFVSEETPDRTGSDETYSLLFDMNAVFESYIAALMRRVVCPPELTGVPQVKKKHLLIRGTAKKFRLLPDIGIYHGRKLLCLVDTKWKVLDRAKSHEGVVQADMYQMYAYAKEYDCPLVILLYPRHGDFGSHVASYRLPPADDRSPRIEVCTVDVSKTSKDVAAELKELVAELLPTTVHHFGQRNRSTSTSV